MVCGRQTPNMNREKVASASRLCGVNKDRSTCVFLFRVRVTSSISFFYCCASLFLLLRVRRVHPSSGHVTVLGWIFPFLVPPARCALVRLPKLVIVAVAPKPSKSCLDPIFRSECDDQGGPYGV